jgi:hypothetical protein
MTIIIVLGIKPRASQRQASTLPLSHIPRSQMNYFDDPINLFSSQVFMKNIKEDFTVPSAER